MLGQTTTASRVTEHASTDPVLERVAWILLAAIAGLVVREVWQAWRARQEGRARDQIILSAVLRELSTIVGVATSMHRDINRERAMINEAQRWRVKPLVRFPTTIYTLVTSHVPASLLRQEGAVPLLMVLQEQCMYSNALAEEQQKWKAPSAQGLPNQMEIIISFHEAIMESVNTTLRRCATLQPLVVAAGDAVGGLNLAGRIKPPDERDADPMPTA
jgi:hypothetical protein